MRAVQLVAIGQELRDAEVPLRAPGPREAAVRVMAAGICHSDAHYRSGVSPVGPLPLTLGHEVAGVVSAIGEGVTTVNVGQRVCVHYLLACGDCEYCVAGQEQFCRRGKMLGKHCDGGFVEYLVVPARNLVPLPDGIPFAQAAVLMCSSATSLHALRKARLKPGETVAVYGCGGLGMSAVQLARAGGALDVYAVDIDGGKLALAQALGATPVDARSSDPVQRILALTGGRGVDVAVEVIGLPETMSQAIRSLAPFGRAVMVGIADRPLLVHTYTELIGKEAEVIGSSDHLLSELPLLLEYVRRQLLDLSRVVTRTVPLSARAINGVLDDLERFTGDVRTVIVP